MKVSDINLGLPNAEGVSLKDLQLQQPPFAVNISHLHFQDSVKECKGVIGHDGELIRIGNFVKMSSPHNGVCSQ